MKIVTVFSGKGGAGKTTTVGNLAIVAQSTGLKVGLLDLDPQRSCADWWAQRGKADIPLRCTTPAVLRKMVTIEKQRGVFDLLVIDTPPGLSAEAVSGLDAADFVVLPVRPAVFDLRATIATLDVVKDRQKEFCVLINAAPPGRDGVEAPLVRETRVALKEIGARLWRGQITHRVAITYAAASDRGVFEDEPAGPSAGEFARLWRAIDGQLGSSGAAA